MKVLQYISSIIDDTDYIVPVRLSLQCSSTQANLTILSTDSAVAAGDSVEYLQADLICNGASNSSIVSYTVCM